jgi:hypothetical protein
MFDYQKIKTKQGDWNIVKVHLDPHSDFIFRAARQAKQKAKYTIQPGQDGISRSNKLKLQNQFRGMIAEIYAVELIKSWLADSKLNNWEVIRYDDVRTDNFESPTNEYDLKIQNNSIGNKVLKIESRSSVTYARNLIEGINDLDIIGPYTSQAKPKETYIDYYIRPLYNNTKEMKPEDFSDFLKNGFVDLYFVAGCSKNALLEKGIYKSMKQNSSKYRCLPIILGSDIIAFQKELLSTLY